MIRTVIFSILLFLWCLICGYNVVTTTLGYMRKKVRIKYISSAYAGAELIQKPGGDWIDLKAAEDMYIKKGKLYKVRLGVCMQLPKGYEAHLLPRSSAAFNCKFLLANSMGLIDNSYCGDRDEWQASIYAMEDSVIRKGERICQFRIEKKQPEIKFEKVSWLGNKDRGSYGSTGRY